MWDLIVSSPDHCLSFYFTVFRLAPNMFCVTHQLYGLLSDMVRLFYMRDIFVCRKLKFENAAELEKLHYVRQTS